VDRIVAEAQVVKATFYRHFPAKDDLVCAYLAELSERQLAALRRLPADAVLPHALASRASNPNSPPASRPNSCTCTQAASTPSPS
jgi:AcrR family transcriptional regulator